MKNRFGAASGIAVAGMLTAVAAVPLLASPPAGGQNKVEGIAVKQGAQMQIAESAFYRQRFERASPAIRTQITQLRQTAVQQNWTFSVSYTEAMDRTIAQLAGLREPANLESQIAQTNRIAAEAIQLDNRFLATQNVRLLSSVCTTASPTCSYASLYGPVRNQGACGSCWAFSSLGAYEGAYRLKFGTSIDTSEQHMLSCSGHGTCSGGWWAYPWMLGTRNRGEAQMAYTATNGTCAPVPTDGRYRAAAWGYVTNSSSVPSVAQIKAALVEHGPLTIAVRVTPAFQAYSGGVFNQMDNGPVNHGVTLIGWDDSKQAWRIRNSWGAGWGESGNMWIRYGSNRIGYAAAWVRPVRAGFIFNPDLIRLIQRERLPIRIPELAPAPGPMPKR